MQQAEVGASIDARWEEPTCSFMLKPTLPPLQSGDKGSSSIGTLPLLIPHPSAPAPPDNLTQQDQRYKSRLQQPRQRYAMRAEESLLLKFPTLVKPLHKPVTEPAKRKCNQEEEDDSVPERNDSENENNGCEFPNQTGSSRTSSSSSAPSRAAIDKNRDFIKELEEKKRKEKEDQERREQRKQKLHEKLSRKILNEAAQARQKNIATPEVDDSTNDANQHQSREGIETEGSPQDDGANEDNKDDDAETNNRKEKAKRQRRLLKKQQAYLEKIEAKKRERQEEFEKEQERERQKHEKVKSSVLDAIYDTNKRLLEDNESNLRTAEETELERRKTGSVHVGPMPVPVGGAIALLRERKELSQQAAQDEISEEQKQRLKEQRDAINKKQQEYLQKLAEQRKNKQKEEEDARILQERKRKKIQQEAMLRLQEAAKQQQEAAASAKERQEAMAAEKPAAGPPVDVEAMIARLSKLKDRDAQEIPEARDFNAWKKRHGVRLDQKVFCMTGWYPVIREELEKRGWYYNQEKVSPFFDLKWSLKSDDLKGFKLEKDQYVNHFFQNTAITTKVGLLHNLRNLTWFQSEDIDTTFPRAYDLNEPRDMETFVQDFRYVYAEGLLKEIAKYGLEERHRTLPMYLNQALLDVLLSVGRKKVKSKRGEYDELMEQMDKDPDALEESIDNPLSIGTEELVTDLEWEVLTKCQMDKPGKLRASLTYKKRTYADDKTDSMFAADNGGSQFSGPHTDTVLTAYEKKQQKLVEKQRIDAFNREKARLGDLMTKVAPITEDAIQEVIRVVLHLEKVCPQFHMNGGGDWLGRSQDEEKFLSISKKSLNVWIVKPAGMSRGRGIRVFNNLDLLLEYADVENHKECQWVAQKYIENPLLVCKRKFDIRQWVLVTGWDPLTIWFNEHCYLRFSSEEYSMDDLTDQYVHLTNNSIQKYSDKFNDIYTTEDGDMQVEGNMWHSDDFKEYLRTKLQKPDVWESQIQKRMKEIVVSSLQCVQDMVQHRKNCCELYGYDFMLDETMKPWLIEVNSSPACDYSTPTAKKYVEAGLAGIIKIIVDHRDYEQKKKYGGGVAGLQEPDTGCWQRIHKAEHVGKPLSSFGADFHVKGLKVQKTRRSANINANGKSSKNSNIPASGFSEDRLNECHSTIHTVTTIASATARLSIQDGDTFDDNLEGIDEEDTGGMKVLINEISDDDILDRDDSCNHEEEEDNDTCGDMSKQERQRDEENAKKRCHVAATGAEEECDDPLL